MGHTIAIYGGTFDPIHLGHLRAALEVAEELRLEQVVFMPSAAPPHDKKVHAPQDHRLEMVRRAVAEHPRFAASDLEIRRGGKSRTVDTLEALKRERPDSRLLFLIGADAFFEIHTWARARRLFDLADFVVMERPGAPIRDVLIFLREHVDPAFFVDDQGWARVPGVGGAKLLHTTLLDISSTDIRRRAAKGRAITFLVLPVVEDYIKTMGLYSDQGVA